jgi:PAS domain S-box-containing protein
LVSGHPGLRFYAAMPLLTADGFALGTVAVMDLVPRTLNETQIAALKAAASQVMILLELRVRRGVLNNDVGEKSGRFNQFAIATADALWDWDLESDTLRWNQGIQSLFGVPLHELGLGTGSWIYRIHPDDRDRVLQGIHAVIDGRQESWADEYRFRRGDGAYAHVRDRGFVIRNGNGAAVRMLGAMTDNTARRQSELEHDHARLEVMRINRALQMRNACSESLIRASSETGLLREVCRLAIDIGGYRMAWSGYVQDVETACITPVAHAGGAGNDDGDGDFVNRLTTCLDAHHPDGCGPAAEAIRNGMPTVLADLSQADSLAPCVAHAREQGCHGLIFLPLRDTSRTFGLLALYSTELRAVPSEEIKLLQALADEVALGILKLRAQDERRRIPPAATKVAVGETASGGAKFFEQLVGYSAGAGSAQAALIKFEGEVRRALERDELLLHYQPQVSLSSGAVVGIEALVRWQHPEFGLIPPGRFIGLAEETGLILPIGEWVLRRACEQNCAWQRQGLRAVPVSVNLSARQFADNIAATVQRILAETGLEARLLELELTESASMEDPERTFEILCQLKDMGVQMAIDDFGTGYSNLSYLKRFPVDKLKLDQSFVKDITSDPDDLSIARAVIAMAHGLRLTVIAEGVETAAQLALLAENGCDEIQGYFFSRPVEAMACGRMLRERKALDLQSLLRQPYERTLLYVDDEANLLAAIRREMRHKGYRVLFAANAAEAFEILATVEVGVIVCDQCMPGMSGTEFLSRVKYMYPDVTRMILSGYADLQSVTGAVNQGAIFKFLTKPWRDDELADAVRDGFAAFESKRAAPGALGHP